MDHRVEYITPSMASRYLEQNTNNRPLRARLVDIYARQMEQGQWQLTHQGIAVNCDGTLLDGQHRLAAIVQSNRTVPMIVVRGIASDAQLVMDDHAKRTPGDALSLLRHERVTQQQVATLRAAVELSASTGSYRMTKLDLNHAIDVFCNAYDFVAAHMQGGTERGVTSAVVKAALCLAWFYVNDLDRLSQFINVIMGHALPDGPGDKSAVLLRELLIRDGMKGGYSARRVMFLKTQRSIAAFMAKEPLTKIYATHAYYQWPLSESVRS